MYSKFPKRLYSIKLPTNAPTVAENEQWLDHLSKLGNIQSLKQTTLATNKYRTDSSLLSIPYRIIPPETKSNYMTIESPLKYFTSTAYLHSGNLLSSQKHTSQQGNFIDLKIIRCVSGNGGSGAISFFRDAGRAIGPPDGGDGGTGGSIYVQAVEGLASLAKVRNTYCAQPGLNGKSNQLDGSDGKDILITVPTGTILRWCVNPKEIRDLLKKYPNENPRKLLEEKNVILQSNRNQGNIPRDIQLFRENKEPGTAWLFKEKSEEYFKDKDWFQTLNKKVKIYESELFDEELKWDRFPFLGIDLDIPTEKPVCLIKGGKGGLGNMHFLTETIRNPKFSLSGRAGLESWFMLELKSLADVGLIGFPNAGKSTILNKISNAKPRIGHWKFTTLKPTVGTISTNISKPTFTVADIPGIVEDASNDKGMGLDFIRHIERSKGWAFVIGLDRPNPLSDLQILVKELGGVEKVTERNILIVCNKADVSLQESDPLDKFLHVKEYCSHQGWECVPISALNDENIDILKSKLEICAGKT